MSSKAPSNEEIAQVFDLIAELLEAQQESVFRVEAYHRGANTARRTQTSLAKLAQDRDVEALKALPNIGPALASTVLEYVQTGRSSLLDRLKSKVGPAELFGQLPGIGPELAHRIADELNVGTLEELEQAAHDGRLAEVEGFGPGRTAAVRDTLAGRLNRSAQTRSRERTHERSREQSREQVSPVSGNGSALGEGGDPGNDGGSFQPDVATILEVDAEYRRKAAAGQLRRIAPRRFNPAGEAWLPILNTRRNGWSFTVLFSNTARAHDLDNTQDWVVIYFEQKGRNEDQCTVVTERQGPLAGKRVVRGREIESREYYQGR